MPKISNEERDRLNREQRDNFMQATWRCFSRNGQMATSMEDVAREAGSTLARLYLHFQTKDELVRAVMVSSVDGFEAVVRAIGSSDQGATRLTFVSAMLEGAQRFGIRIDGVNLFTLAVHSWSYAQIDSGLAEIISLRYKGFIDFYAELSRTRWGLNAEDSRAHAVLIAAILLGYITQVALATGATAEEHIAAYNQLEIVH